MSYIRINLGLRLEFLDGRRVVHQVEKESGYYLLAHDNQFTRLFKTRTTMKMSCVNQW